MHFAILMNAIICNCATIVGRYRRRASTTFKSDIKSCANRALGDTETENAAMQVAYRANQFPVMVYTVTRKVRNMRRPRNLIRFSHFTF